MSVTTDHAARVYASGRNCLKLAAIPDAPRTARRFARDLLGRWNMSGVVVRAELVISELVTNAVKEVGIIEAYPRLTYTQLRRAKLISICLYRQGQRLVIEVWDPSTKPPVEKTAGPDDEGGRGLLLVQHFTDGFGYRLPKVKQGGKVVWCSIVIPI
jgi:anti-sigma regulatory factor (Ser/Thr protein kinase)